MENTSTMNINVRIKPELTGQFIALMKGVCEKDGELARQYLDFIEIVDGYVVFKEYTNNWYGDGEFARFLAPFAAEGSLVFRGKDGTNWGYWFDGKGNIRIMEFIERPSKRYFHRV